MSQTGENQQQLRVELIEAHHVLTAMKELGWMTSEKAPALAAIQAQLRKMYLNGGHTNRLSRLREEAIVLNGPVAGSDCETTPAEAAEIAPLPEALDQRLSDCAAGIGSTLSSLHNDLAIYLASYRAGVDRDDAARIEAAVKSAHESISAAEDELNVALAACNDSADRINELTAALSEALSAAAAAVGKAEVIDGELVAARLQLSIAENEVDATRVAAATATGRADAVERELASRTARVTELEAGLAEAQALWATATANADGRAEAIGNELSCPHFKSC